MKNISTIIMIMTFLGCSSTQGVKNIDAILVYKKFLKNGTPARVNSAFINPGFYKDAVDTRRSELYLNKKQFETSLQTATVKKYLPQKIGEITFAGEFYTGNEKHFFLYFQSIKLLIDFTEKKRYILKDSLIFTKNCPPYFNASNSFLS